MSPVRYAQIADEPALFEMLVVMHRDNRLWAQFPYDTGKIQAAIELGTRQRGGIIGVIDAPDRPGLIAASVALLVEEWWWSRDAFMQQRWTYVRPEYRAGYGYADDLMRFADECRHAMANNLSRPLLLERSFIEGDERRCRIKDRWWRRWGRRVGGVYISGG